MLKQRLQRLSILVIALIVPGLAPLYAQQVSTSEPIPEGRHAIAAVRISTPVRLDGVLDDDAWQRVEPAGGFVQWEPYEGEAATERTDIRVLYDSENLYIGVQCYDSDPGGVLANSLKEDFEPKDADYVEIILDTYRDLRNGFLFTTNPMGAKRDAQVTDEGRNVNVDWDTVWGVRAQPTDEGWVAEIVIPFKSLSFDLSRSEQVWGINFSRSIRRKNEIGFWSPVPRRYNITRLSLAGELRGLTAIERGRNLRVKPFAIADIESLSRNDGTEFDPDAGLDVKYSVTPSLTLDVTVNTDFSQVEVDEQQINLTRFPVIFPEKREFFLENAGIFQFGDVPGERGPDTAKETQLFFSRRIGLYPEGHPQEGQPIGIWGGVRMSGRTGPYTLGVLSMQTKEVNDDAQTGLNEGLASNNYTVARLKRDVFANSDIGAIFVNRQATEANDYNRGWGIDGNFRFFQNLTINGYLAQTKTGGVECKDSCNDRAEKLGVNWRDNRLRIQAIYSNIREDFHPEVGIKGVPAGRDSARGLRSTVEVHTRPPRNPIVREINPHYRHFFILDPKGDAVYQEGHFSPAEFFFHNGSRAEISFNPRIERLDAPYQIPNSPNVMIPAGEYRYAYWQTEVESDPSRAVFATLDAQVGAYYTGHSQTFNVSGSVRPGYRWLAQATFVNSHVTLEGREYTNRIIRGKAAYSISTRMFLNALVQYNSSRRQITSNIRFDLIHRPLSDLFLVYNEVRNTAAGVRDDRVFTIKYTHMLAF